MRLKRNGMMIIKLGVPDGRTDKTAYGDAKTHAEKVKFRSLYFFFPAARFYGASRYNSGKNIRLPLVGRRGYGTEY